MQEKINYNYTQGAWKDNKVVEKGNLKGIQVSKDDEIIKEALTTYQLKPDVWDKALRIIKWRQKERKINESKEMSITR